MQRLEVSGAVRYLYGSLGFKWVKDEEKIHTKSVRKSQGNRPLGIPRSWCSNNGTVIRVSSMRGIKLEAHGQHEDHQFILCSPQTDSILIIKSDLAHFWTILFGLKN